MGEQDVSDIQKFEADLLHEFEKRKCLLVRYTEDGLVIAGGEPPYPQYRIVSRDLFDVYSKGRTLGQIADSVLSQAAASAEAGGKQDGAKLIAIVRDGKFMLDAVEAIKKQKGIAEVKSGEPALPVAYQWAQGHSYYILCGIDTGSGYSFVTQEKFGEYGLDDKQMRTMLLENAYLKLVEMINGGLVRMGKVAEGVFAMRIAGGLAPTFLVISNVFFDFLKQATGISGAEFFYAYPITTEEILIVDPKAVVESMNAAKAYMMQSQEEGRKNGSIVLLEPLIVSKTQIRFLLDELQKAKPPEEKPSSPQQ